MIVHHYPPVKRWQLPGRNACAQARRPAHLPRAFTFLEVLLVLAVLVALAGLIVPNLGRRRERAQLEYITAQVTSLLTLARSTAMSRGRRHRCVFGDNGYRVWIEAELDPVGQAGQFEPIAADWARVDLSEQGGRCVMVDMSGLYRLIKAKESELLDRELPDNVYEQIEFRPDGRCDSGIIILAGASGENVTLDLDGLTGRVKVSQKCRDEEDTE